MLGVSSALAHHYLKSGWLVRLGRGVFMFPNDTFLRTRSNNRSAAPLGCRAAKG